MGQRRPSSQLLEFVLATSIGLLAVFGGLLCVGFLLVAPVRNPNGVGDTQPLPDYEGIVCIIQHTVHTYVHVEYIKYKVHIC